MPPILANLLQSIVRHPILTGVIATLVVVGAVLAVPIIIEMRRSPLPLSYNLRNLVTRRGTTIMTAVGIALTVAVLVTSNALLAGLHHVFESTGNPREVIVLRKGGNSELTSVVSDQAFQEIKLMPQVAAGPDDVPLASPEMVNTVNLPSVDSPEGMNVAVRGLTSVGVGLRHVTVEQGRAFDPGHREVMVGKSIAARYPVAQLGKQIRFGRGMWTVVGVFSAGDSAANSEIWCDLNQLRADYDRQGHSSSVLVSLKRADDVPGFVEAIKDNTRLGAAAMSLKEYYANQQSGGDFIRVLGTFVAIIMAIGATFGAMNTMYAAVARRTREIGTLRALGFSRFSVLLSFVFEAVLLALIGGVVGILITLPLNFVTTGVGNWSTFSEVAVNFRVTPEAMVGGLAFAAFIGIIGGLLPAWAASRKDVITAMREV